MKTNEITLTVREITDLAKAVGLIITNPSLEMDADDLETEYVIYERESGVPIGDEEGKNIQHYKHGAYLEEYPEEGTFPLGEPLMPTETAAKPTTCAPAACAGEVKL